MTASPPVVAAAAAKEEEEGDVWRSTPGFVLDVLNGVPACPHFVHSRFLQYQVLLGAFLFSRRPSPLTDKPLFDSVFEWGRVPLEKVVQSAATLDRLALSPFASRNSVSIVEPCRFVGFREDGRGVRASKNVAYALQLVCDCDCALFPLWKCGVRALDGDGDGDGLPLELLIPVISSSRAVIVEGGDACVYRPDSWKDRLRLRDFEAFIENLLLNRYQMRSPSVFICLGHQLACNGLNKLIARVIDEVRLAHASATLAGKGKCPNWLEDLREECLKIEAMGQSLTITEAIRGFRHPQFTVCANSVTEVGRKRLVPFEPLERYPIPRRLLRAHKLTQHRYDGHNLLSTIMKKYGVALEIVMFHADRVNFEAVLFANWALSRLHSLFVYHRSEVVRSSLAWVLNMPCGVEVCASTAFPSEPGEPVRIHTSVAACAIFYEDLETTAIKSSFSLQFHGELCDGIRTVGDVDEEGGEVYRPSYNDLHDSDGIKLLFRMLHVNSQLMS